MGQQAGAQKPMPVERDLKREPEKMTVK